MFEFTFDLGPLHLRFSLGDTPQPEQEGAASGGGVYSTHERVDYPYETEVDVIGFRPSKEN